MNKTLRRCNRSFPRKSAYRSVPQLIASVLFLLILTLQAQEQPLPTLFEAEQVRRLSAEEAAKHYPVRLRNVVVTSWDAVLYAWVVQDQSAGIYIYVRSEDQRLLKVGQRVEIEGVTDKGEYAPVVNPLKFKVLGEGDLPTAKPVTFEQLASGQEDSQFVEVRGVVRFFWADDVAKHMFIELATGGGRLTVCAERLPSEQLVKLVDSTIRVRGVCLTSFNRQRQLFRVRLIVPRTTDLIVEQPAPKDPFAAPSQTIGKLLQFAPEAPYGHRVKVTGTVVYRQGDSGLYIQYKNEGLFVQTRQKGRLQVGDRVEVLGFPAKGDYTPTLEDAVFRKISSGPMPAPAPEEITSDQALKGTHDSRLVKLEATLLDRSRHGGEQFLVLESNGFIFQAHLDRDENFASFQNGSIVAVVGVCVIEAGDWYAGEKWRAKSFRVLLRSADDVTVLANPPWWTFQRMLWMVAILALIVLGASVWVAVLRRRVNAQTKIIRQKLQDEAKLKERYLDLLENANDIVYTHDLEGRLTSINKAGEELFRCSREKILSSKITSFVAKEQQDAAGEWLEQVLKGTASPTAEWDFVVGSGERVKLEISTRRIEENGNYSEVEGIARDITERKRLETELLEISNREQRRIGHDLHDGVLQHLVGIGYLADTLADELQERGIAVGTQAERISQLLKVTITQTRGVARGLFPVRLEENGLVSAIHEFAANSRELFKINCTFVCEDPPPLVDNSKALHLYYITLEAVANSCKHGQAKNISIALKRDKDHYVLSIKDDGAGFLQTSQRQTGMGIRIMHYRARVIGATLSLQSKPNCGTHVTCLFQPVSRDVSQGEKD